MSDEEYHADTTAIGSSSVRAAMSSLKLFHGIVIQGKKIEASPAMKLGSKIHMAVLERERFMHTHRVMPEFTGLTQKGEVSTRSKEANEKRALWLSDLPKDCVVVTQDELEMMTGIAESIMQHPQGKDVLRAMVPEVPGFFLDNETGIRCKIKPDLRREDGSVFIDLKTTKSCEQFAFGKQVFGEMRIDIQLLMYAKGIEAITGKFPRRIIILAVEKVWPYEVAVYSYNRIQLQQAETDYHATLKKIRHAVDHNHWPMRQQSIQPGHVPEWFIRNSVEREDIEL